MAVAGSTAVVQVVVLQVGGELYGAQIPLVREVREMQRITMVPGTPAWVVGVTNLRGGVIPVIDLRRRLGLPATPVTRATRIAVAEIDLGTVGMIVDAVTEVVNLQPDQIEPPSPVLASGELAESVRGVARLPAGIVTLLDLPRVLARGDEKAG